MRASEFLTEQRTIGEPTKRQSFATRGLHKFRDPGGYDRTYELNRIMMAVASADGINPLEIDAETWSGRYNTAHPYTDIESKMLKQAYKTVGDRIILEPIDLDIPKEVLTQMGIELPQSTFKARLGAIAQPV